jgi:hypothetical protein
MDDRLRIPQDPDYFHSLGLAAVAFARLEWNAVWCCERLSQGYIQTIERDKKTAGRIARDLKSLFQRVQDATLQAKTLPLASKFIDLVDERNGLMHGKPGTSGTGDQRLFRGGSEWTIQEIDSFADDCVKAASPLNSLLYNELSVGHAILLDP